MEDHTLEELDIDIFMREPDDQRAVTRECDFCWVIFEVLSGSFAILSEFFESAQIGSTLCETGGDCSSEWFDRWWSDWIWNDSGRGIAEGWSELLELSESFEVAISIEGFLVE